MKGQADGHDHDTDLCGGLWCRGGVFFVFWACF